MERILIIDDDAELCAWLSKYLRTEGFEAIAVHEGNQGLHQALSGVYALVLLNDTLLIMSGLQVLREIRSRSDLPVLMMNGSGTELDRIEALEMGADDNLPKPFNPRELVARIRAILRRTKPDPREMPVRPTCDRIAVGDIEMDTSMRIAYRDGSLIELTSVEFSLLEILLRAAGQVVSREELARGALGRDLGMNDRSIDVHISSLRKKLGQHPGGFERIRSIRNLGYLYTRPHRPVGNNLKVGQETDSMGGWHNDR